MADGEIVISTKLDASNIQKELNSVLKDIAKKEATLEIKTQISADYTDQLEPLREQMENLRGTFGVDSNQYKELEKEYERISKLQATVERSITKTEYELKQAKDRAAELEGELEKAPETSDKFAKAVEKAGKRIKNLVKTALAFSVIRRALNGLRDGFAAVIQQNEGFNKAMGKLKGAMMTLATPILNVLIPAFTFLINVITLVISAVAKLYSLLFGKSWDSMVQGAKDYAKAMNKTAGSAEKAKKSLMGFDEINVLQDQNKGGGGGGFNFDFSDLEKGFTWESLKEGFDQILEDLMLGFVNFCTWLATPFAKGIQAIGKLFSDLWNSDFGKKARGVFSDIGEFIVSLFKANVAFLSGLFGGLFGYVQGLWDSSVNMVKGIVGIVTSVFTGVGEFVTSVTKALYESVKLIITNIASFFTVKVQDIRDAFSFTVNALKTLLEGFQGGFKSTGEALKKIWTDFCDLMASKLKNAWEKVKGVFSKGGEIFDGFADGVSKAFKTIVNGLINGINSVIAVPFNAINNALKKIRDVNILGMQPFQNIKTITVPTIPKLAQGTVAPPNKEFLAILGDNKNEPEVVSPLSTMKEALAEVIGEMGGSTVIIDLDGTPIYKAFVNWHNDEVRRGGASPLNI